MLLLVRQVLLLVGSATVLVASSTSSLNEGTALCGHILAAAEECPGSTGMAFEELAKWSIARFVKHNFQEILSGFHILLWFLS